MRRYFRERMAALAKKAGEACTAERCGRCDHQILAAKAYLGRNADGWRADYHLYHAHYYCTDPAIKEELRKLYDDFDKARQVPVPRRGERPGWTPPPPADAEAARD